MSGTPLRFDVEDPRLTAYAVGELDGAERAAVDELLARDARAAAFVDDLRATAERLQAGFAAERAPALTDEQRARIAARGALLPRAARRRWTRRVAALAAGLLVVSGGVYVVSRGTAAEYRRSGRPIVAARAIEPAGGTFRGPGDTVGASHPASISLVADRTQPLQGLGYAGEGGRTKTVWRGVDQRLVDAVDANTEAYAPIAENPFRLTAAEPLSTFSIDVDTASYANVRRFLRSGELPPPDAVRIEELVNYFRYAYPAPSGDDPFSVTADVASCPWAVQHRLVRIGLRAKDIDLAGRVPSNLVFLVDVSGSMSEADKLPLLVRSMKMLVEQLDGRDRVALVVYAGSSGLVLPSTTCDMTSVILNALDGLSAGGSTNGGAGIELAYRIAAENRVEGGNNRVILCTDGDFNVGTTDQGSLVRLIEQKRASGTFLSVLGFGRGNLQDSTMELLADKGNGNYAYIDTLHEARKVLVEEMGGTLFTVAKDVKIQVELNPNEVRAWRLIGYENRLLAHQDFNDDARDAGEIGAGHSVTALYEIVPVGVPFDAPEVDARRYVTAGEPSAAAWSGELMHLKLRFKRHDSDTSELIVTPVRDDARAWQQAGPDFGFAAAVAGFGMVLRQSEHAAQLTLDEVLALAVPGLERDPNGYRAELVELVQQARALSHPQEAREGR